MSVCVTGIQSMYIRMCVIPTQNSCMHVWILTTICDKKHRAACLVMAAILAMYTDSSLSDAKCIDLILIFA